ncbi:MAG: hypothetical protein EA352_11040 [Gemmatimonadales bacterium]|nr:MAG: hypothetical protein EA352_11040 [Gemmatimonadales bacterium]
MPALRKKPGWNVAKLLGLFLFLAPALASGQPQQDEERINLAILAVEELDFGEETAIVILNPSFLGENTHALIAIQHDHFDDTTLYDAVRSTGSGLMRLQGLDQRT